VHVFRLSGLHAESLAVRAPWLGVPRPRRQLARLGNILEWGNAPPIQIVALHVAISGVPQAIVRAGWITEMLARAE
jgi:hypothetical protein